MGHYNLNRARQRRSLSENDMNELDLPILVRDFAIDVVAVVLLAFVIYFRRYRRREPAVGYLAFNLSIFTVAAALSSSTTLNLGVGFGLFAVLSIVRLRSDEGTPSEIGYTMVALVIGLMNGLPGLAPDVKIVFSAFLVAAMYVADHPRFLRPQQYQRLRVQLDRIITDEFALRQEVEGRIGATVKQLTVLEIDYVRDTMRLDVRATLD
jgi:hypothetical protein